MTRREVIDLCLTLPQTYEDYPFDEVADDNATAVIRHKANKKSFALIMRHKGVIPGYRMNKTHWNTVIIGSDVPQDAMLRMLEKSYDLIRSKTRRKKK